MKIWATHYRYKSYLRKGFFLIAYISVTIIGINAKENSVYSSEFDDVYQEDWVYTNNVFSDPLEDFNRIIFKFNDISYEIIMEPASIFYRTVTTEGIRNSLSHFIYNLKYPIRLISNILQFKFQRAYYESLQFSLNSTLGILGIFRPSDYFLQLSNIPEEDLGQLLAFWGIPEGPYLVLPFIGPSNLREIPAKLSEPIINPFETPIGVVDNIDSQWLLTYNLIEILVISSDILPRYNVVKGVSIDPYTAIRNAYILSRRNMIKE